MGVKVLWSGTNRTELVQASAITIVQGQHNRGEQQGVRASIAQSQHNGTTSIAESLIMERNRLVSTLRGSSSLANEAIRTQFLPQSMLDQQHQHGSHGNNMSNNDASNKRRKISSYSSWLQEKHNSIPPVTTPAASSIPSMGAFANMNPVLNIDEIQNSQQSELKRHAAAGRHREAAGHKTDNNVLSESNVFLQQMLSAKRLGQSRSFVASKSGHSEDDTFLQQLLSAKHSGQRSMIAAREFGTAKKQVSAPTNALYNATTTNNATANANDNAWDYMYRRLMKHMKERGMEKVPTRIHMDPELRDWVAQQRLDFKKRNVSSERQFLLRSVGFHRDKFTLKWDAKFERLQEFKKEHGNTNVPFHYAKDRQLGTWVSKQRVRIRQGTISDEEKVRLEAIGFVPNRFNARWEEMFRRLVAYKKIYGDANVPRVYEKDSQLAQWVLNQKDAFREGKMKPERQIKLEAIGFCWSTFFEGDLEWEENFQKVVAHKYLYGHVRFFNDTKLARWIALQQSLQSMGSLNQQRMGLLVSIGVLPGAVPQQANLKANTTSQGSIPQSTSSSVMQPPMGLRQSFEEWSSNGNTSTFL